MNASIFLFRLKRKRAVIGVIMRMVGLSLFPPDFTFACVQIEPEAGVFEDAVEEPAVWSGAGEVANGHS